MCNFNPEHAQKLYDGTKVLKPTVKDLWRAVHGLSEPGKMPWYSYNLPARACGIGHHLRTIPGSVCSKCYARKGRYVFPNVQDAMERRLQQVRFHPSAWAAIMVALLERKARGERKFFRWHDSGDLQGPEHLAAVLWIAKMLPNIAFWLPTKESVLVDRHYADIIKSPNITVRISASMIGKVISKTPRFVTSSVGAKEGFQCPAHLQSNKCGDCRACWDKMIVNVDYKEH